MKAFVRWAELSFVYVVFPMCLWLLAITGVSFVLSFILTAYEMGWI